MNSGKAIDWLLQMILLTKTMRECILVNYLLDDQVDCTIYPGHSTYYMFETYNFGQTPV